jgi:phosphatidylserine/phosphatidylglycerophosphate/cardiolipin synthase-like enzyme
MSPKDNKATRTFQEQNGGPYRDWPFPNLAKLAFRLARLPDRLAAARGVKVRVWRDAGEAARLSEFDVEAQLGGRVQGLELRSSAPGGELMHLKGYCVDHRLLRTGSANFSRSGETRQDNDLVALRGSSARAGFDAKFGRGWGS